MFQAILRDKQRKEARNVSPAILFLQVPGVSADGDTSQKCDHRDGVAMATSRVVVKRSLRAPAIVESPPPQASFKGKSVRIDRYRSSS
ncbi:MAG: hypothetical protein HN891_10930 [Planctomycetes bacterium]|nr:hypothetical protein [Planctomycetota bacterium]